MKNKKIILAGGTGFIGQEMTKYFGRENQIVILTRQLTNQKTNRNDYSSLTKEDLKNTRYVNWDGKTAGGWFAELNGADLIINLAGKSVNCRYNERNKNAIFDSRTDAVNAIGEAIGKCQQPRPFGSTPHRPLFTVMQWTDRKMNARANFMMISPCRYVSAGKRRFMIR